MNRRQFIAVTSAAGVAGLSGYANRQDGGTYMEEAQKIGFTDNWQARRIDVADDWPIDARSRSRPRRGNRPRDGRTR